MNPCPKILVVDDTYANLVAMRRLLAHCGADLTKPAAATRRWHCAWITNSR